jgi:hypothetical protein
MFTPRGLSQHISRTRDPRCAVVYDTLQIPSYIPHTASPPALDPFHASWDLGDDAPGGDPSLNPAAAANNGDPAAGIPSAYPVSTFRAHIGTSLVLQIIL